MSQKERVEFRASSAFVERLDDLAATMKVSKAEVIRAAIDTLEMVVNADRQGKGIVFAPKKPSTGVVVHESVGDQSRQPALTQL